MEAELSILLKEYGLTDKEIKIYLYLVGNNQLTAYKIAKQTKIHRSTCYDILEKLINKGFVSKLEGKEKLLYSANEASKILTTIKNKEAILNNLIPKLQHLEQKQQTNVKFLENPQAQHEFDVKLLSLLKQNKISFLYMIGSGPTLARPGQMILVEKLIKEAKKAGLHKKIDYKGLWDVKFKEDKFVKLFKSFGEDRFLKGIPTKATTIIFDDHIAFLYTTDTPGLIEIKNQLISKEMKTYFEFMWKIARK